MPALPHAAPHNGTEPLGARHGASPRAATDRTPDRTPDRTLVALIGQLGGGERMCTSLAEYVLAPNQADLVLMIDAPREGEGGEGASSAYRACLARARHVWTLPEPSDWSEPMDAIAATLGASGWRGVANRTGRVGFLGPARVVAGSSVRSPSTGGVRLVYRHMLKQRLLLHGLVGRYSRFVLTRADHVYGCAHDVRALDLRHHVYIPRGEDNGGVNDGHMVCGRAHVLSCLSILEGPLLHPERYVDRDELRPEAFLKLRLQELALWARVRRTPRVMFLASAESGGDAASLFHTLRAFPEPAAAGQQVTHGRDRLPTDRACTRSHACSHTGFPP